MADATYPLFSIFAFIGFLISLIPLPWHLQAWNSGTCYYMMWASIACLNQFINSVVWANNAFNHSPIWCEISIRILLASSVGLPAASLCINRRLYQIASVHAIAMGHAEKSRAILIDTLLCVLFPLIFVALQYVVQGHRFDILEDIGCYPAIYNTLLAYFINSMWPIVIGLISASYCVRTLCAFAHRRLEFSQFLNSSNPSLTMSRYFRLMALAFCEILFTTPLAIFNIWLNATVSPIGPWRSWEDTHLVYSRIGQVPAFVWRSKPVLVISVETTRWVTPLCALVFFAFFGFADEARRNYSRAFKWVVNYLPLKMLPKGHLTIGKPKLLPTSTTDLPFHPLSSTVSLKFVNDVKHIDFAGSKPKHTMSEKNEEPTIALDLNTPSTDTCNNSKPVSESQRKLSWEPTIVSFSSRRHSSYF